MGTLNKGLNTHLILIFVKIIQFGPFFWLFVQFGPYFGKIAFN